MVIHRAWWNTEDVLILCYSENVAIKHLIIPIFEKFLEILDEAEKQ